MTLLNRVLRKQSKAKVSHVEIETEGLVWNIAKDPDSGGWFGVCDDLNLNADGETLEDLDQCIGEVMSLLFLDLSLDGELEEFLQARGWEAISPVPRGEAVRFDVVEKQIRKLPEIVTTPA